MSANSRLHVVLCWHMHQPEYRDLASGNYQLPWTYLHAIKDYVDMAAHLEQVPAARAVFNFAPVLLDQLADYAAQIDAYLKDAVALRDPLLAALDSPALPVRDAERLTLIKACLRANRTRMIEAFPVFRCLAHMAAWLDQEPEAAHYFSEQYLADLVVWYHLAWMGETVRRRDARIERLITKGSGYSLHERRELLEVIGELIGGVIGRYRALAERGQIELSMNPYAHPIVPLLLDLGVAREAMPEATLPSLRAYPGGDQRARWHIEKGVASFERHFGFRPHGCWPSEGGVSDAALKLFGEYGFRWTASGGGVLGNTLHTAGIELGNQHEQTLYRPFQFEGSGDIACFFRDDALSDLIGFKYATWHGDDAADNLVQQLENIAAAVDDGEPYLVPIILDGENAWEYYPNNGYYFLSALYKKLVAHPRIELTTFSDYLAQHQRRARLPRLVAGSWVFGTFSTWIGDKDKNRAWDMLGDAKLAFDRAVSAGRLSGAALAAAEQQLAACEGSDWCWWFGDYNPAQTVSDFERLYRLHLANLYHLVGEEPPEYLSLAISHGGGTGQHSGTMRPGLKD